MPDSPTDTSRRDFLAVAAALTVAGTSQAHAHSLLSAAAPLVVTGTGSMINWRIEAVRQEQHFGDGSTLPFFRFASIGTTPSAGILPMLKALAGQPVRLTLLNSLPFPVQPTIVGFGAGPQVAPGQTTDWDFQMPAKGTWLLSEALLGTAAGPVGFAGTVVSIGRTKFSQSAKFDTQYDQEYTLLYQDADDRWNLAVDRGDPPDTSVYEPNYHTLNGLTFPETIVDPDTMITCRAGNLVLIRFGNLGHVRHAIHAHGYHAQITYRNRVRETRLPPKDTFPLPGHTTAEIELRMAQAGVFPIHPHNLTCTTDNGTYPFGQITMIDASE
jgi:FtsP/CotA-like multicopper oxidase with cupredoxin domain